MIETSSNPSRTSSKIFGNLQNFSEMYGNVPEAFGQLLAWSISSENRRKCRYLMVCLYNEQNNTWLLVGRCRKGITPAVFNQGPITKSLKLIHIPLEAFSQTNLCLNLPRIQTPTSMNLILLTLT